MKKFIIIYIIISCVVFIALCFKTHQNRNVYDHIPKIYNENSLNNVFKENIGTSLIQGQVIAINPIEGKYSYMKKKYQTYETHISTSTDSKGHPTTRISHDWETKKTEELYASYWQFYNLKLPITQLPFVCHIRTEKIDSDHRIVYEGCNYIYNCTIKGDIRNNTINMPKFYFDQTIEQVVKAKTTYLIPVGIFILLILIGVIICCVIKYL